MGFRDLECFNLAMLAKQGWRLLKNSDSLAARILKAKYYPHTEFRKPIASSKSSYIWRSILEGKCLLESGLRWRVGNGADINVWDEPWIPKPYSFKVTNLNRELWPQATVKDLISWDVGRWNLYLLQNLFFDFEVEIIQNIPLAPWGPRDELVWHYSRDGIFSVKSAYQLAMNLKRQVDNSSSTSSSSKTGQGVWKKLWNLDIPPRIKTFLWRAATGTLATGVNLYRRIHRLRVGCCRCGANDESDKHLFFECIDSKEVWKQIDRFQLKIIDKFSSFIDWFAAKLEEEDQERMEFFAVILWLIWKSRNEKIFEGKGRLAQNICRYASNFLQDYKTIHASRQASAGYQTQNNCVTRWTPPMEGMLKINIDGSYTPEATGVGLVIRNQAGDVEAVMTENIPYCFDATHAEALGFLKALEFARDFGISHSEVEGDAQEIINKIKRQQQDLSMVGHIIKGIQSLMIEFPVISINFTPRICNRAAHEAARLARKSVGRNVWFSCFPKDVMLAVIADFS